MTQRGSAASVEPEAGTGVETVDAVVIGAGPNGLVAANILAARGWEVTVLEAAGRPGGAVRTEEAAEPGFRGDLFSAFYPLAAASPVIAELELWRWGLRWRRAPDVLAHVLPDGRAALLSSDIEATAASLAAFAGGDAEAWRDEYECWRRIRKPFMNLLLRPFPPVKAAKRLLHTLGAAETLRLARTMILPARRLGAERFAGEGARALLAGNAMHSGIGPDQAGSGCFGWLLSMLGQDLGFPVPEGGAGSLTDALVARLEAHGGRVDCRRPVAKVLHARGRAVGVRDADGEAIHARRAVLADVSAPALYLDLVGAEHLPRRLLDDLDAFEWDQATLKVDWTLDAPIPWEAPEAARAGTVHLGTGVDGLSKAAVELTCGRTPDEPLLLMGQMSTADPSRSPEGTETAWAYTRLPQGPDWTEEDSRRLADRMQRTIERYAPGFTDLVRERTVVGPAELERMDRNLVGGAINGGSAAIHQQLVFRPVPGTGRADTVLDRLYLASASAHPGGAVHGAPGANAARAALARDGWAGGPYRAAVGACNRVLYGRSMP
ncbi:phytoene desaturase family protein [Glycomyces tenuis]|uniref:phytoene desaturase family protein n=1 Tax=Glycomyces tenuis TaxID=58116 RepID=UPI000403B65F|nr:NAD(P)/FAD-dependent oxidoreductase [Glycomyces tenuis]